MISKLQHETLTKLSCLAARTSDDFFPDAPDSHRFHVVNNPSSALLHRFLSLTPDFDMFTTHHPLASYHAQLRTFSNAPIYITDDQKSDPAIFAKLGGLGRTGEYTLIKAGSTRNSAVKLPGSVFEDTLGAGEGTALKVGLAAPSAEGAIIGIWSTRAEKAATADVLRRRDIADALSLTDSRKRAKQSLALFFAAKQELLTVRDFDCAAEVQRAALESKTLAALRLEGETHDTITVAPIRNILGIEVAVLGLVDKFAGLCAVESIGQETLLQKKSASMPASKRRSLPQEQLPLLSPDQKVENGMVNPSESTSSSAAASANERTPLLQTTSAAIPPQPEMRTSSSGTAGSRLWAIMLFFRSDLRSVRRSFCREFWRAPLYTLWREMRAALGGPSTLPVLMPVTPPLEGEAAGTSGAEETADMAERSQGLFASSVPAPKLDDEQARTRNGETSANKDAVDRPANNGGDEHAVKRSVHAQSEEARVKVCSIRLHAAGQLGLVFYGDVKIEDLDFYIEQEKVEPQADYLEVREAMEGGKLVILDMVKFVQDKGLVTKATIGGSDKSDSWRVSFSKR